MISPAIVSAAHGSPHCKLSAIACIHDFQADGCWDRLGTQNEGTNAIQSLPKVPDLKETALLALGLVQHQLLCGKGIPLNPYSLSVRQKLLFQ